MKYLIELKQSAVKELQRIPQGDARRIIERLRGLEDGLKGDVKKLTNHTPEYRLRVGNWRVLFEISENTVIIYHIKHRREAYL